MIHAIGDAEPVVAPDAFVAWNAEVAGDAVIGEGSSVWFGVTVRADIAEVRIGAGSNLQDGTVVHVNVDVPCIVGDNVTVGHRAILHGCVVGDDCLIGMGAVLLNGSEIGPGSIVGAGSLVTQGKRFPARSMIMGSPARLVREVSDEEYEHNLANAREYVRLAREARGYRRLD
ncbi:MAG: gamma carbonic anhydrase family protein [Spirochaetae bacterium HGW-Spirochaetae-3]|jgi:carbonic anhydrase/acetyltransferase-like protein (isoleucine patch superfamily)|nr:MAG: gamma carbonic anhydrase family protein [Spirochaetae bacterium HGW-Spirochaetae-3]